MIMRVLDKFPAALDPVKRAGHPHHVPVRCDCGTVMAIEHTRAADTTHAKVTCPVCKTTEEVSLEEMCAFLGTAGG